MNDSGSDNGDDRGRSDNDKSNQENLNKVMITKGVVGFCQLLLEGMPSDMHTSKAGEAYILVLGVEKDARSISNEWNGMRNPTNGLES